MSCALLCVLPLIIFLVGILAGGPVAQPTALAVLIPTVAVPILWALPATRVIDMPGYKTTFPRPWWATVLSFLVSGCAVAGWVLALWWAAGAWAP